MTGIDWGAVGQKRFDDIVDVLLGREFGSRGHAVNGRGGDGGIDYDVDDSKLIFQYKYFPEGFSANGSRRNQIRRSFAKAMTHGPEEWILVVPATVTPPERRFVTGLGKGKSLKITIRDKAWLNSALADNPGVAEYYRFGTDIDYLFAKGERFKHNPVVRDMGDVHDRVRGLLDSVDTADPNWALDFYSIDGQVTQILRAKDPRAAERSPIEISFTLEAPPDSAEVRGLEQAHAFGHFKSIVLPSDMVKNFRVSGPRLVRQDNDEIHQLELHPRFDPDSWRPAEVVLADVDEEPLGAYLAEVRLVGEGQLGFTMQIRVAQRVEITFRCPHDTSSPGNADWSTDDLSGVPAGAAFEAADFVVQFRNAATLDILVEETRVAKMDIAGSMAGSDLVEDFKQIRDTAEDLKVIETGTRVRFRYPSELTVLDRIMIRNLRLMLEGHCVAHPTHNRLGAKLSGFYLETLDQVLTPDYGWFMQTGGRAEVILLGQRVPLPALNFLALARPTEGTDLDELKAALRSGNGAGRTLNFELRPGDRVRMYLPDRMLPDQPLDITPWGLPGVNQKGLGPDGTTLR
jgi:hypothetical protein